ncbi:hypothetical protein DPQ33_00215 [Oceanidesulfovibrio indonesiensis]|uniref:SGNH hydrolase-type esterase domain-containing protein n=1 Tax=Oceanidesulfovibrio indonesiensis TaxID=54767 RepID=A0A7M3MJE0_9BACT|nr:GDSL-type esterase/lipase family protein [Oceanidesulfovibrio indonesiensis]TVM19698.1 hypothetical protein DPQ33_00215 [Oceanidesulfovibrio indonesiensis]
MIICFIGDSLVNGVSDPDARGWVGRLLADIRGGQESIEAAYNLGIRRNSSADILVRWEDEVQRRLLGDAPMRLVFSFGAADMAPAPDRESRLTMEESIANARAILTRANELYPVIMVGPPPMADPSFTRRLTTLDKRYAGLCAEFGIPYLHIIEDLRNSEIYFEELVSGDGVHPGAAGYAHIFRLVNAWPAWRGWLEAPIQGS